MSRENVPPDEHLRTALRHAPDAALAAPPDLSAQILAAAHRAAADPPPAPVPPRRPWWVFQTPLRLGASGAFATVLLAGLVGVLWHGQQPGPATEAFNEAAAPVAAPAPVPAAKPAPEQDAPQVAAAPEPPRKMAAAPAPRPAQRQAEERQRQAQARVEESKREAGRDLARLDERRGVELQKERAAPQQPREEVAVTAAPPPPPAPVLAQAPVVAAAPAPAAAAMADANPPTRAGHSAPAATGSLMARPRPNAPWMDALAAGSQVQWSIDGEARAPGSSWLYALAEQTQGRWRAAPSPQLQAGDNVVQWQRGETLLGRLWLGNERVLWCDAQGRCEEAALAADVTSVLRKGLAR